MNQINFQISKTAKLVEVGEITAETKYQWLCLHGYGQLAQYFIDPFENQNLESHYFIAPEGMHRFYLNGTYGRVGASWMTKEERLVDIEDNIDYLESIFKNKMERNIGSSKLVVFAFSQGAATLVRWLEKTDAVPDIVFVWAGSFPEDVIYPNLKEKLKTAKIIYAIGKEDEFATVEARKKQTILLNQLSDDLIKIDFNGKHKIYPEVLNEIISKYI